MIYELITAAKLPKNDDILDKDSPFFLVKYT